MLQCADCGAAAGELPDDGDLTRSWLRCVKCGGKLEKADKVVAEDEPEVHPSAVPALPNTQVTFRQGTAAPFAHERVRGCRITPKFILGHHTANAKRHYMSVSG